MRGANNVEGKQDQTQAAAIGVEGKDERRDKPFQLRSEC